jgi:hypothetical protein
VGAITENRRVSRRARLPRAAPPASSGRISRRVGRRRRRSVRACPAGGPKPTLGRRHEYVWGPDPTNSALLLHGDEGARNTQKLRRPDETSSLLMSVERLHVWCRYRRSTGHAHHREYLRGSCPLNEERPPGHDTAPCEDRGRVSHHSHRAAQVFARPPAAEEEAKGASIPGPAASG